MLRTCICTPPPQDFEHVPSGCQLVTLQCPSTLSAAAFSDSLIEAGALYVSVSDGAAGTAQEEPIFAAHSSTEAPMTLESWDELLEAKKLWNSERTLQGVWHG